jgi:hypothetical protein
VGSIHINGKLSVREIICFRGNLLFIDASDWIGLVDHLIENDHVSKFAMHNFIEVTTANTS